MSKSSSIWNRDFALLWQGGVVSALGGQAYEIAIMLWAKQVTQSGMVVGAILFAGGISFLLMPLGGVLADRYSRTRILVLLDLLGGICALGLAALFFCLPDNHFALIPALLLINFVRGSCTALFHPVATALVPDLVPTESLTRANSTLQTTVRLTILIGKSIGGMLFRVLGAPLLLFIDGISFVLSAITEMFIREPPRVDSSPGKERTGLVHDLREGFRFTARLRGFRLYVFEASCVNLCLSSLFVILPFYVEDVLNVREDWYGYLLAAMGFGALIGGLIAGRFDQPGKVRGTIHIVGLVFLSGSLLPLSFVHSPWVAMCVLALAWACVGFHTVILTTLVQKRTPQAVRGRIFSLLQMIRMGLMPVGMALFGMLIDLWDGPVTDILFWAGATGLTIILCTVLHPDYRWFFVGNEDEVELIEQSTETLFS